MYFHIILTEKCNSQCRYCYGKSQKEFGKKIEKFSFDFSSPCDSEININDLKEFVLKDKNPKIIFYGGEPLLKIEKIKEIIDALSNAKYYMQTNAKLLNKLPKEYLNKFSKILISIDGDKERTDFNRGNGTYDLVIKNLKLIRQNGFKGEIIARMTISFSDGFTDLKKQVKHLLDIFDSVHWQLDMGFYESDYDFEKVQEFIEKYNIEVSNLIDFWVKKIENEKVLKIYPFLGIFNSIYKDEKTKLRCGSGYANYTITTNGKIVACPITSCIKNFQVGDIKDSNPNKLKEIPIKGNCLSCSYFDLCGGRCLYSNYAKLWPEKGEKQICNTIKHLINEIKKATPRIRKLIEKGIVKEKDFEFEKYFGPEIIP
ncbi:MAG: TIGR04084 family radical SAM/SPASM domain-containing protein [Nanoarchaeota archaeon]